MPVAGQVCSVIARGFTPIGTVLRNYVTTSMGGSTGIVTGHSTVDRCRCVNDWR